jgi:transposase
VRSYLLKEDFQFFWCYRSSYWAGQFLDHWCTRTMRSKLEPMEKIARMLRGHRALLLNWFRAKGQLSSAVVEGFNGGAHGREAKCDDPRVAGGPGVLSESVR